MSLFGYLDPGSGSILIQALIAVILGAGIFFRRWFFYPVVALLGLGKSTKEEEKTEESDS